MALVESPVPDLLDGQVLVRNTFMSVDPYLRGRMGDQPSYVAPFALDEPMEARAVGTVVASRNPEIEVGAVALHGLGWRELSVLTPDEVTIAADLGDHQSAHLGLFGVTGMTAWMGLFEVAGIRPGEALYVSSAAGAVGATVAQLAKFSGATVIGSAGTPSKIAYLRDELGFDAVFDYHEGPIRESLRGAMEEAGVKALDIFFDNVGGEQLEAAIRAMRPHGRIVLCGAIAVYNSKTPQPGPRNLLLAIQRSLRIQGFLLSDFEDRRDTFLRGMTHLLDVGAIKSVETRRTGGIEAAWPAFLGMLRGENTGKMIVALEAP